MTRIELIDRISEWCRDHHVIPPAEIDDLPKSKLKLIWVKLQFVGVRP